MDDDFDASATVQLDYTPLGKPLIVIEMPDGEGTHEAFALSVASAQRLAGDLQATLDELRRVTKDDE